MSNLIEKVNGKNITTIVTSVGGIVLALFLGYVLFKVLTNDLTGIKEAINNQSKVQMETNAVLRDNIKALESNSSVLRILERRFQ